MNRFNLLSHPTPNLQISTLSEILICVSQLVSNEFVLIDERLDSSTRGCG